MFRSSHSAERAPNPDQIIATLETHELDPETTLVMGSAALVLYELLGRPASDVDLKVPGGTFEAARTSGRTPGGFQIASRLGSHEPYLTTDPKFFQKYDSGARRDLPPLAIDMTYLSKLGGNRTYLADDEKFLDLLPKTKRIKGYHVQDVEEIIASKREKNRRKDRRDIQDVQRHLENQGGQLLGSERFNRV